MSSTISRHDSNKTGALPYRIKAIYPLVLLVFLACFGTPLLAKAKAVGPLDLAPLQSTLTSAQAKHLVARAGFGATQQEIASLVGKTPQQALQQFTAGGDNVSAPAFEHSGIFEPGLDPFPPSRPATTELAKRQGHALGIDVKPDGNRPLQPIVNQFFY